MLKKAEIERDQVNGPRSDISLVAHSAEARSSTSVVEVLPTDHPIAPVEPPITEFVPLCSRKAGIEAAHNATSGGWHTVVVRREKRRFTLALKYE